MEAFLRGCRDLELWSWPKAFGRAFVALDKFRRWARGCKCHERELLEGKTVDCPRLGRRMQEAPSRVAAFENWLSAEVSGDVLQICEGNVNVRNEYESFLRSLQSDMCLFAFVTEPPYVFANAADPDFAWMYVDKFRKTPANEHHSDANWSKSQTGA